MLVLLPCRRPHGACVQKLRMIPSNVDEFMALMSAMAETQERYEGLMERKEFVQAGR